MIPQTKPLTITKWKFLQLNGGIHQSNGINFQLLELTTGFLYKWQNENKWYAAHLKTREAAWVFHKLVEGKHLSWSTIDSDGLL